MLERRRKEAAIVDKARFGHISFGCYVLAVRRWRKCLADKMIHDAAHTRFQKERVLLNLLVQPRVLAMVGLDKRLKHKHLERTTTSLKKFIVVSVISTPRTC